MTSHPFGRKTGIRSTRDTVNQLRAQLDQLKFNVAESKSQLAVLSDELAEARIELARRNAVDVLASAPSPPVMKH